MKKKVLSGLLALTLCGAMSLTAFAAGTTIDQNSDPKKADTTITTTIAPTYTVTIPENKDIVFLTESTDFGSIGLSAAQIDPGYAVKVSAQPGVLKNKADASKTIPYVLNVKAEEGEEADAFTEAEYLTAGVSTPLTIDITQEDWNNAFAGAYEGIVTFAVEYVKQ